MMRIFPFLLFVSLTSFSLFAQTSLEGRITEEETGEELIFANIYIYKNGVYHAETTSNFDGYFTIELEPGVYDIEGRYIGFPNHKITGVVVKEGQQNKLNIQLPPSDLVISYCPIIAYPIPVIIADETTSGMILRKSDLERKGEKNLPLLISNSPGISIGAF